MSVPLFIIREGSKWSGFVELYKTNPIVSFNLIASGLYFYGYNEVSDRVSRIDLLRNNDISN